MPFAQRPSFCWRLKTRSLPLGERTLLMGILNCTPDSFSDGNRFLEPQRALDHALALLDAGADILDLGGESTRPNATPISAEEEQARILPVLSSILKARPDAIVSIDTYHAATAGAALEAGAEIINDVSGLKWDPGMAAVLARFQPGAVLMHARGTPQEWPALPPLAADRILPLVLEGIAESAAAALAAGLARDHLVLDPGYGFGKRGGENFLLHARQDQLQALGYPMLTGTSRKRFLTAHASKELTPELRLAATLASSVAAILAGAHILRVHDVPETLAAAAVADAILAAASA